jgi:hypothetical protein
MATTTIEMQEMDQSPKAVNRELLEQMLGQALPEGVLGVIVKYYTDWEDDEIAYVYVVYADEIDLDSHDGVPEVDYLKITDYIMKANPGRIAMTRSVNLHQINDIS